MVSRNGKEIIKGGVELKDLVIFLSGSFVSGLFFVIPDDSLWIQW